MSTSRTSSTPATSSSLRPRTARLISGLSDAGDTASPPRLASKPPSRSPSTSRGVSPLPSKHTSPSRSTTRQRRQDITSNPRTASPSTNGNVTFASLWGTSWSAIQNIANDLIGEQEVPQQGQRRRKNSRAAPPGKLYVKPAASSWGPPSQSSPTTSIAAGSREEREAMLRAQKRKDLLSGAAANYPDALGRYKRRTSDEGISSSAPPGANEDRDALVYLHHVKPEDTLAGITIRYSCQANVLRKANRMWPNDTVQVRKILTLPVDACGVKGRPVSSHEADLLQAPAIQPDDTSDLPTPRANGSASHRRADSRTSTASDLAPPSSKSSTTDTDPPWTHDSWVLLPNASLPTEIARLPRRTLGYFPPARRKSQSYSDLDTPSTSLDISRSSFPSSFPSPTSNSITAQTQLQGGGGGAAGAAAGASAGGAGRPTGRMRRTSSAANGYFPSYLAGPGGVGTMARNVLSPGPAQDGLNKLFAGRLPNVAPPVNQAGLYLPDVPLYSDEDGGGLGRGSRGGAGVGGFKGEGGGSGTVTPTGLKLENVGAAVEGWVRRLAVRAQGVMEEGNGRNGNGGRAGGGGGGRIAGGGGDLIEMHAGFEIGEEEGEEGEGDGAERGRMGDGDGGAGSGSASVSARGEGEGSGVCVGEGGVRSRGKAGKKD